MLVKTCFTCGIGKPITEYRKAKTGQYLHDVAGSCKICQCKRDKIYRQTTQSKEARKIQQHNQWLKRKALKPWYSSLRKIKDRCNNPNYIKWHRYGGRGIKCLITEEELRVLWFRDKAYELKQPSIDRINNDGNYEFSNCQYIEHILNSSKDK